MLRPMLLAMCLAAAACAPARQPSGLDFLGTTESLGGLSGISYDAGDQLYYTISAVESRLYAVRVPLSANGIGMAQIVAARPLLDGSGRPFVSPPPTAPPDPEGVGFDVRRRQLYWCSERESNPWIRIADLDGDYRGEFTLPRADEPLDGLTVTPSGRFVWAAMQEPGALTRIAKFDVETRAAVAQYAYPQDSNSAPGLVALSDTTFLVVERSHGLRVYRTEVGGAVSGNHPRPMTKRLLADLSRTRGVPPVDDIDGITLGPVLPDGRQSLVLVSAPRQVTRFLAFAM